MAVSKKIAAYSANLKSDPSNNQAVAGATRTVPEKSQTHRFQWAATKDGGTAWCGCDGWQLWNCTEANGRTNYRHHLTALPDRARGLDKKKKVVTA